MENCVETNRLILRNWEEKDLTSLARLNQDAQVMEFLYTPLTLDQSKARLEVYRQHIQKHGWGLWAVSERNKDNFIGWIGLWAIPYQAHFTPAIEVGWRLLPEFWGKGYATEGAKAALDFGFKTLNLEEIVGATVPTNVRSRRVMEKLGMKTDSKDDFDFPTIEQGHPLRRHVLYRLRANQA